MSKKQIQKRLNKLFDNLPSAEDYPQPEKLEIAESSKTAPPKEQFSNLNLDDYKTPHQTDSSSIPSEKTTSETQTQLGRSKVW